MLLLRSQVGDDADRSELIRWGISLGVDRVVVKRPRQETMLDLPGDFARVSYTLTGKTTCYDVYRHFIN